MGGCAVVTSQVSILSHGHRWLDDFPRGTLQPATGCGCQAGQCDQSDRGGEWGEGGQKVCVTPGGKHPHFCSAPLQKNTQKNIPEIGHFRSPQVMMPKNSAIRSFFCKCLINWTLNLLFFFWGYCTIRYDEISSSPLSLPSRPQMARWLKGLGVYISYHSFPVDFWMHGTSSKSGKSKISEISFGNQLPGPMFWPYLGVQLGAHWW